MKNKLENAILLICSIIFTISLFGSTIDMLPIIGEYVIQKLGYDPGFAVIGFIGYALFKMVEICAKILIRAIRSIIKSEKK